MAEKIKSDHWLEFDDKEQETEAINQYFSENRRGSAISDAVDELKKNFSKGNDSESYALVMDSAEQLVMSLDERVSQQDFPTKYGVMVHRSSRLIGACAIPRAAGPVREEAGWPKSKGSSKARSWRSGFCRSKAPMRLPVQSRCPGAISCLACRLGRAVCRSGARMKNTSAETA